MKQPISLTDAQLESIIESLKHTLNVLNNVDYECDNMNPKNVERTAPYAIGYAKAEVTNLMETVQAININN
tara:strand:+ start:428 stop:640 length:213 start_codon:yes stop_codon:yes gene_type:complete